MQKQLNIIINRLEKLLTNNYNNLKIKQLIQYIQLFLNFKNNSKYFILKVYNICRILLKNTEYSQVKSKKVNFLQEKQKKLKNVLTLKF